MSSRTKKSVSLKPRSPVSGIVISISNYPIFFQKFRSCVIIPLEFATVSRHFASFQKCDCFFCFARLMSEFLIVGRSWSGSFIPPYRSVVTRCAAISLESPVFHRDRARCSRAENGALWKTSYAPPRYTANAFQRERKCTQTLCTRWCFAHGSFAVDSLAFAIALFFFSRFFEERDKFSVFESVCGRLSSCNCN